MPKRKRRRATTGRRSREAELASSTRSSDPVETSADDIFDGGQTKDTENLDEWLWKGGEPNDKNDIEHAFAAAYEHPTSGDLIIYFGLDRMDNNGDAAAGFWFLKKPVEQKTIDADGDGDTENVFVFQGTNTLATHSVGDTLVQTDFTKGGSIERVEAYQWGVAPAGARFSRAARSAISHGADCDVAVSGDNLCGQVNKNGETVPGNWPELTVGGVTDSYFFKVPAAWLPRGRSRRPPSSRAASMPPSCSGRTSAPRSSSPRRASPSPRPQCSRTRRKRRSTCAPST